MARDRRPRFRSLESSEAMCEPYSFDSSVLEHPQGNLPFEDSDMASASMVNSGRGAASDLGAGNKEKRDPTGALEEAGFSSMWQSCIIVVSFARNILLIRFSVPVCLFRFVVGLYWLCPT